jgi:hypothetical protein
MTVLFVVSMNSLCAISGASETWNANYILAKRNGLYHLTRRYLRNSAHKLSRWYSVSGSALSFGCTNKSFVLQCYRKQLKHEGLSIAMSVILELWICRQAESEGFRRWCNTQNHWVYALCPSSGILKDTSFRKLAVSDLDWVEGDAFSVRCVRKT